MALEVYSKQMQRGGRGGGAVGVGVGGRLGRILLTPNEEFECLCVSANLGQDKAPDDE
jgi:hypothetical protein